MMMTDKTPLVRLDSTGVMHVGRGSVPLEAIVASYRNGNSLEAIIARYPPLTREELEAALEYDIESDSGGYCRGPQQRETRLRPWDPIVIPGIVADVPSNETVY